MSTMKSIETIYKGHNFRSRTEARWAVFFDELGIKYQYENQDVLLNDRTRYLPDFYLPNFEGGAYVEVKGQEATEEEASKCIKLADMTGKTVLLLEGAPDFRCFYFYQVNEKSFIECPNCFDHCSPIESDCKAIYGRAVERHYGIVNAGNKYGERMYLYPGFEGNDLIFREQDWYDNYKMAVYSSRSSRFEFGQSGSTINKPVVKEVAKHIVIKDPLKMNDPKVRGKIKKSLKDIRLKLESEENSKVYEPLTQERLEKAWEHLINKYTAKKSTLIYALKNIKVYVTDQDKFEIIVKSALDQIFIEQDRSEIVKMISSELKNDRIGFIIRVIS